MVMGGLYRAATCLKVSAHLCQDVGKRIKGSTHFALAALARPVFMVCCYGDICFLSSFITEMKECSDTLMRPVQFAA